MNQNLSKNKNETAKQYKERMFEYKAAYGLTWAEIADIINDNLSEHSTANKYRKEYYRSLNKRKEHEESTPIECTTSCYPVTGPAEIPELEERYQKDFTSEYTRIKDERNYIRSVLRRVSRENTIKDIAKEAVQEIQSQLPLIQKSKIGEDELEFVGTLLLSDWHYGIEIDNPYNFYDPDEFKVRIENLKDRVIYEVQAQTLRKLNILNLGDLISGRIHNTIRISNRVDIITQIITVSEILAEFIDDVSNYCHVDYYDCLDNHSRIEPNLEDSLQLENLVRIIRWFLIERLKGNERVKICENEFGPDIITFNIFDYKVAAVHGNHDKQDKVIDNITMITRQSYDLICSAHFHHFSADEKNKCVLISNPSLMGTDEFAEKLRLTSIPAQTLIISDKYNVCRYISRILVD